MNRYWCRWPGALVCALALLLASQLAQAGVACNSDACASMPGAQAQLQQACMHAASTVRACAASEARISPAVVPVAFPDAPACSGAAISEAPVASQAAARPRLFAGPAPGFSSPPYILFRRYLS